MICAFFRQHSQKSLIFFRENGNLLLFDNLGVHATGPQITRLLVLIGMLFSHVLSAIAQWCEVHVTDRADSRLFLNHLGVHATGPELVPTLRC